MSMPPEEFYGKSEPQKAERDHTGSYMVARMTSALVFLRTGLVGAFLAIAVIHLLGPSVGYAGNAYDLGGLFFGFALGTVIEFVRRNRGRKST
ncbi:hypothetical protein ABID16_001072 [Rhizobium aquaticum]|uniref:Uncharacterized protein n=1 Tax=Rhizobium aquaticum TaxID=1549636 RepID=A0ABV2IWA0_9HYPH